MTAKFSIKFVVTFGVKHISCLYLINIKYNVIYWIGNLIKLKIKYGK